MQNRDVSRLIMFLVIVVIVFVYSGVRSGCNTQREQTAVIPSAPPTPPRAAVPPSHVIELPKADQRLGTAVAVLLDTSGSMERPVPDKTGQMRPKEAIAKEAIQNVIDSSQAFVAKHPDRVLELGIYRFSSGTAEVLPMGPFDAAKAREAVARIPKAAGGTAIGDAMQAAFKALYRTGCTRKYVVCITDGENTVGSPPDVIGRLLYNQTQGEVEVHFVAFDVDPAKFGFLKEINGYVVPAQDGAQLASRINEIYEKRILAEAPPGEK